MTLKKTLASAILAFSMAAGTAQAADVLGSSVDSVDFNAALTSTAGWAFAGSTEPAFVGPGAGELELRGSDWPNSFGFGTTAHGGMVTVFGTGAGVGATATIPGLSPSYLFWFNSNPAGSGDDTTQWTDGHEVGENDGGMQIFFQASTTTWAFFFDDGGGAGGDDNDYNDMVVTFRQGGVPAPGALSLLGVGLLAAGIRSRRKQA